MMRITIKKILSLTLGIMLMSLSFTAYASGGVFPAHEPYGTGIGVMPGRVVWSHNPQSVDWDGNGYWWNTENFNEEIILAMVNTSVATLVGRTDAKSGWSALFSANKQSRGKSGGYAQGEKIAIKANINGSAVNGDDTSGETKMSYTNPVLLKTLLLSLVSEADVSPSDITVYDVSRLFPDYMTKMCSEGVLQGVNFVNRNNGVPDTNAAIDWSYEFNGLVNYLPTCVTEAEYVINLANLKGHSYGITLCGKNHFGSFINGNAMRPPEGANLHQFLTRSEMNIYSPLVDLMANANLGGKTVLYMLDAIICATSEGASITGSNSKWQMPPFNNDYTSSIFISQDPVAIDSVGADFLTNEPTVVNNNSAAKDPTVENYLHEAGLVSNAPSGTVYTDSQGNTVTNLGVHEHWNNASDKKYSRNLGKGEGIELVTANVQPEIQFADNIISVIGAPENSVLIVAGYNSAGLAGVKRQNGSGSFSMDVSGLAGRAERFKAFLWDKTSIVPLSDALAFFTEQTEDNKINLTIGGKSFSATLEDNETAKTFRKMLPLSADMTELNGNEKYYVLPQNLPTNHKKLDMIYAGDIMAYGDNYVVLFYKTFVPGNYSYTKIGRIDNPSELALAVGNENITVKFE